MSAKRGVYDPLGYVVVRTPLFPVEFYRSTCGDCVPGRDVLDILDDPQVERAISSASHSLMHALRSEAKNEREAARARRKLRRYLIRMSTRPTPFGAVAGLAIAGLGQRTTLRIDETNAKQVPRLDVPWLLQFVYTLESDPQIFRQLKLQANPCILERGGRVYIRELNPLCQNGRAVTNASLRATRMVKLALTAAALPTPYSVLVASLAGDAEVTEKIERFVTELWRQGFLLTDLRPPFTKGDPARYLLDRLKTLADATRYESELQQERTIHVDSVFPAYGTLNVAVAKEAARTAELLLSLTPWPSGPPYLQAYRRTFEDRYGTDREVPFLEMSDPEYGIGTPPVYNGKKSGLSPEHPGAWQVRRELLFEIARNANDARDLQVELDEATLDRLRTWVPVARGAPATLEINVFVAAPSVFDLDHGRFDVIVGPNVGAMEGGRSLGRFAEALGSTGTTAFCEAARAREAASPDKDCVELSYLPRNLELTNILARPSARRFEISVGVQAGVPLSQAIALNDLVVGIRENRFFVRSPALGRELSICSGTMANVEHAPAVCRLLADLMLDGMPVLRDFDWGAASMLSFLPRVRAGRAILSLARWRITAPILKLRFNIDTREAFRRSLNRWRSEWKVPRHVHLTEADNRLLLDLENEMDVEDLREEARQLSTDRAIVLEEVYPGVDGAWLPGSGGRFVAEYVVPLVAAAGGAAGSQTGLSRFTSVAIPREAGHTRRVKNPGSDWLYVKLYGAPSVEDDLLTGPIRELTSSALESASADRWFFVRYADPDPHIRLRFHGAPTPLLEELMPKVIRWAADLVNKDRCLRFAIDSYEREIERYGGGEGIGLAEELFFVNSESALALLPFLGSHSALLRVEAVVFSLDLLFEKLGCSALRRSELFKDTGARRESGIAYRRRKEVLQSLLGPRRGSPLSEVARDMLEAVEPALGAVAEIGRRLRALEDEGRLSLSLRAIYKSIAHMHCNRFSLDAANERLAYGLLTRTYAACQALSGRLPDVCMPPGVASTGRGA
jgi:lantibiotic biosynthesis protein